MFYTTTLSNGIRVACEERKESLSFYMAVWIKAGSCNENDENNGISHFIEHMLFKGTKKRTARELAFAVDRVGGMINAFTAKECTCFYLNVTDENMELAIDVLSDIVISCTLEEEEMNKERGVILEEIAMVEDTPDDLVNELLGKAVYGEHPLGRTIIGTAENITAMTRDDLRRYMDENYVTCNTVISVAGNFDRERLQYLLEKYFADVKQGKTSSSPCACTPEFAARRITADKKIEQMNICLGFPGYASGTDEGLALAALNNVLGGGMSSRLFQSIREQHGLAYSVYSYPSAYSNTGAFNVYLGLSPKNCEKAFSLIKDEINLLLDKGLTEEELKDAVAQLKGSYVLSNEKMGSTATVAARSMLLRNVIVTPEETVRRIGQINMETVERVMRETLDFSRMSIAVVGPAADNVIF